MALAGYAIHALSSAAGRTGTHAISFVFHGESSPGHRGYLNLALQGALWRAGIPS